jgi:hypothetical protein
MTDNISNMLYYMIVLTPFSFLWICAFIAGSTIDPQRPAPIYKHWNTPQECVPKDVTIEWVMLLVIFLLAGFVYIVKYQILDAIVVPWFTYGLILITLCSFYIPTILWKPKGELGHEH